MASYESEPAQSDVRGARQLFEQLLPDRSEKILKEGHIEIFEDLAGYISRWPRDRHGFIIDSLARALGRQPESYLMTSRYIEIGSLQKSAWITEPHMPRLKIVDKHFEPLHWVDDEDRIIRHTEASFLLGGWEDNEGVQYREGIAIKFLQLGNEDQLFAHINLIFGDRAHRVSDAMRAVNTFLSEHELPGLSDPEMRGRYSDLAATCIAEATKDS